MTRATVSKHEAFWLKEYASIISSFFWVTIFLCRGVYKTILPASVTKADEDNSRRKHRHCTETHTCLSKLSVIISIIQVYNSVLCTSTKHCVGKLLLLTSVFDGAVVKSVEITSRPRNHNTLVACLSPYIGTKFLSIKQELLFWTGSTFLGLSIKYTLTKKICSIDTR